MQQEITRGVSSSAVESWRVTFLCKPFLGSIRGCKKDNLTAINHPQMGRERHGANNPFLPHPPLDIREGGSLLLQLHREVRKYGDLHIFKLDLALLHSFMEYKIPVLAIQHSSKQEQHQVQEALLALCAPFPLKRKSRILPLEMWFSAMLPQNHQDSVPRPIRVGQQSAVVSSKRFSRSSTFWFQKEICFSVTLLGTGEKSSSRLEILCFFPSLSHTLSSSAYPASSGLYPP